MSTLPISAYALMPDCHSGSRPKATTTSTD